MQRRFALLLFAATPLPGQDPIATAPPKRLFVDAVVATVNDTTILQSRLLETSRSGLDRAEAEAGRSLPPELAQRVIVQELLGMIARYQMAQSAKSFSTLPPEQIDKALEIELERDKQDQVRDLGSSMALSEELQRRGQTWPSYAREKRLDKLYYYSMQFAVSDRLNKQSNLYLTPRMLRETYQKYRSQFVHDAAAEVEMVQFTGPDAEQNARAAAEMWRNGDFSPRQIADRNPGGIPLPRLRAGALKHPALKAFAEAGPLYNVSDPVPRGNGTFDVARIIAFLPAADGRFEDPMVQDEVRKLAHRIAFAEVEQQALEQARQRTEVWIYQNGREIDPNLLQRR